MVSRRQEEGRGATERVVVKWATPAEELVGVARLAQALVERRVTAPEGICLVVPSENWGVQMQRACQSVGLSARFEAGAFDEEAWCADAPASLTDHAPVPIVLCSAAAQAVEGNAGAWRRVTHVYLVGCVDGLVPRAPRGQGSSERYARERSAFLAVARSACAQVVISLFTGIEASIARAARLNCTRTKMVEGQRMAVTHPTPFLAELGARRPTTLGGQLLLRRHGLN